MAVTVTRKDLGIGKLREDLKRLNDLRVNVGVIGEAAQRQHPNADGATVGEVANWVHFGTWNIPARPYIDHAIANSRSEVATASKRAAADLIDGRSTGPEGALTRVGEVLMRAVRESIDSAISWAEPLALSTIAKKGHAAPLVDTGTLREATNFEIVPKGGGSDD